MNRDKEIQEQIVQDRGALYGDIRRGHTLLGEAWRVLLAEYWQVGVDTIPPHIVCLMLAQLKLLRAARPFQYHRDSCDDAINYTQFALDLQEEDHSRGVPKT